MHIIANALKRHGFYVPWPICLKPYIYLLVTESKGIVDLLEKRLGANQDKGGGGFSNHEDHLVFVQFSPKLVCPVERLILLKGEGVFRVLFSGTHFALRASPSKMLATIFSYIAE